jgi:hypothetical protein
VGRSAQICRGTLHRKFFHNVYSDAFFCWKYYEQMIFDNPGNLECHLHVATLPLSRLAVSSPTPFVKIGIIEQNQFAQPQNYQALAEGF